MARIKICLVIITIITLGSILSTYTIQDKYSELLVMLEDTQKLMEEGKQEEALIEADKLIDYWNKLRNKSHFLVRCDKIGNINASIARIKPYIEEDNDELNAEFESVKEMLKWFYKSEMPYPNNIF